MKRLFSLALILICILSLYPLTISAIDSPFAGGDGDAGNPYQVSTEDQLRKVQNYLDKHFIQTEDIDLTTEWEPIGTEAEPFTGSYDGGEKVIAGLEIDILNYRGGGRVYAGLFGYISGAQIKNVNLLDGSINVVSDETQIYAYAGSIAGYNNGGTIIGCLSTGAVTLPDYNRAPAYAGGITGYNSGTVSHCQNTGDISILNSLFYIFAGGIAGQGGALVSDCRNTGSITAVNRNPWSAYAGGITANTSGATLNCHNSGDVSATSPAAVLAGGCVGSGTHGTISGCHNAGGVSASTPQTARAGGITSYAAFDLMITDSCNTGNVSAVSSSGDAYSGGIAGQNMLGEISGCRNMGDISLSAGSQAFAGGITGENYSQSGVCGYSYNTGDVSVLTPAIYIYSGGVAGRNTGVTKDCYNRGKVTSVSGSNASYSGGVAGFNQTTAALQNCYNTGEACGYGNASIGSISGRPAGTMGGNYCLERYGNSNGVVLSEAEMKNMASFAGWDFANTWDISGDVNDGYPFLRGLLSPKFAFEPGNILRPQNFTPVQILPAASMAADKLDLKIDLNAWLWVAVYDGDEMTDLYFSSGSILSDVPKQAFEGKFKLMIWDSGTMSPYSKAISNRYYCGICNERPGGSPTSNAAASYASPSASVSGNTVRVSLTVSGAPVSGTEATVLAVKKTASTGAIPRMESDNVSDIVYIDQQMVTNGIFTFEFPIDSSLTGAALRVYFGGGGDADIVFVDVNDSSGGVAVTGKVKTYNPGNVTAVRLMQGNTEKYKSTIAATGGSAQMEQAFSFTGVMPGVYDLVITKTAHAPFTLSDLVVGQQDIDLSQDPRAAVQLITLPCGDINGDGYINDSDLAILWQAANYNKAANQATNQLCDLNGDGYVNDSDLAILWQAVNYNKGAVVIG